MLGLFKYLNRWDHEYLVVYDFLYWPYGDKDFDFVLARIKKHLDFLEAQGVKHVIVPPVYELALSEDDRVLNFFRRYVWDHCFSGSLVGKIWLLGDFADLQVAQGLLEQLEEKYQLTSNQQQTKKFHKPFAYWMKRVSMRKYYLTSFSYSNFMVNKQVKFDLRYFKDADVDTLIPLNYAYFHFEKTIQRFLNQKRIKFHDSKKLFLWFDKLVPEGDQYQVKIFTSWTTQFLEEEKRIMWLLQRGKQISVEFSHLPH